MKTYFYNGLDLLSDGSSKFLHGAGLDATLQIDSPTGCQSYLQDHLGSTSQLVDSLNAGVKARYDYKSYGKLEGDVANPSLSNPFTYTGREDDGTGLIYYRARYYDPELEVFISQDPLGDAQRYVGRNPLSFTDPLGLYQLGADGQLIPERVEVNAPESKVLLILNISSPLRKFFNNNAPIIHRSSLTR